MSNRLAASAPRSASFIVIGLASVFGGHLGFLVVVWSAPARARAKIDGPQLLDASSVRWSFSFFFFLVEEAYTQQGRAHIRRLHPDWAARSALMSRAAHAVESKAVVRIEVAVSPRPCLGCAVELVLRVAPLRRGVPPRRVFFPPTMSCAGQRRGQPPPPSCSSELGNPELGPCWAPLIIL
jgi:hypothetical protein